MRRIRSILIAATAAGIAIASTAAPAAAPTTSKIPLSDQSKPSAEQTPLKVTVVISRWQGDKRVSNLPFTLFVNTDGRTSLRMMSDVPVPTTQVTETGPVTSFQYRPVGTSIDLTAAAPSGTAGRYALSLTVSDSHLAETTAAGPMRISSFTTQSSPLLRDGETQQFTTATDKHSSEVVKIDVTLNVIK